MTSKSASGKRIAAYIVIDPQKDFCPKLPNGEGGNLEVPNGDEIFPIVNRIAREWPNLRLFGGARPGPRILTQDYHPANHKSFYTMHEGAKPFEKILLNGLEQTLWWPHCVQGTAGCEFHPDLEQQHFAYIFRKGMNPEVDSYSAFYDNGRKLGRRVLRGQSTGLTEFLRALQVTDTYIDGLALNFCDEWSAVDSVIDGFNTHIIVDGCRHIPITPNAVEESIARMKAKGAKIVYSDQLKAVA